MEKPLVSVLICTYNAEKFIESTLFSVLNQTYKKIEVLVLDNASTDKTLDIINKLQTLNSKSQSNPKFQIINSRKNFGPYEGLNLLLNKAKGEYIAINDHDDIWQSGKLEKQIKFLETHHEYIGCGMAIINWHEKYDKYIYRTQPEKSDIAWHTSLVFRNNKYRYDTSVKIGTDFYFMKNILCGNKKLIYNFQEPLVLRRIFAGKQNLSGQWMKKISFMDIINLKIGWFDKLALFNRYVVPQEWVERMVVWRYSNNIPREYEDYTKTLSSMISSLRP